MTATLTDLVGALAGVPSLPGARCRGRPHLFDEAAPAEPDTVAAARHAQALRLCLNCPSLDPCTAWFLTLTPAKRPTGVIAGRINQSPRTRKKAG